MTQQEAYAELAAKIAAINAEINVAFAFAREHKLEMGQPRTNPRNFQLLNPKTGIPHGANPDWYESGYDIYDNWIGSEVCW